MMNCNKLKDIIDNNKKHEFISNVNEDDISLFDEKESPNSITVNQIKYLMIFTFLYTIISIILVIICVFLRNKKDVKLNEINFSVDIFKNQKGLEKYQQPNFNKSIDILCKQFDLKKYNNVEVYINNIKTENISTTYIFDKEGNNNIKYLFYDYINYSDLFCNDNYYITEIDIIKYNYPNVNNFNALFKNMLSLKTINVDNIITDNITSMYQMFDNCISLTYLDISKWNISNCKNFNNMFKNNNKLLLKLTQQQYDIISKNDSYINKINIALK